MALIHGMPSQAKKSSPLTSVKYASVCAQIGLHDWSPEVILKQGQMMVLHETSYSGQLKSMGLLDEKKKNSQMRMRNFQSDLSRSTRFVYTLIENAM